MKMKDYKMKTVKDTCNLNRQINILIIKNNK